MVSRKIVLSILVSNGRSFVIVKVVSVVVRAEEIVLYVPNVPANGRNLTQDCIRTYICSIVLFLVVWDNWCIVVVSVRSIMTAIET